MIRRRLTDSIHMVVATTVLVVTVLFFLTLFGGLFLYAAKVPWKELFGDQELRSAASLTLGCTLLSTILASLGAFCCAYVLRLDFPGRMLVETLLDAPMVLPPLVSGVALLIFFGPMAGKSLSAIGLSIVYSRSGIVVAQSFIALPFAIKMFKETLSAADPRFEHIARTLGCSPLQVFTRVTLPLAWRGLGSGIAMTWARTVGEFGATAMLAGVTRMKTETLSAAVFLSMSAGELDRAIAISVLLLMVAGGVLAALRLGATRNGREESPSDQGSDR